MDGAAETTRRGFPGWVRWVVCVLVLVGTIVSAGVLFYRHYEPSWMSDRRVAVWVGEEDPGGFVAEVLELVSPRERGMRAQELRRRIAAGRGDAIFRYAVESGSEASMGEVLGMLPTPPGGGAVGFGDYMAARTWDEEDARLWEERLRLIEVHELVRCKGISPGLDVLRTLMVAGRLRVEDLRWVFDNGEASYRSMLMFQIKDYVSLDPSAIYGMVIDQLGDADEVVRYAAFQAIERHVIWIAQRDAAMDSAYAQIRAKWYGATHYHVAHTLTTTRIEALRDEMRAFWDAHAEVLEAGL